MTDNNNNVSESDWDTFTVLRKRKQTADDFKKQQRGGKTESVSKSGIDGAVAHKNYKLDQSSEACYTFKLSDNINQVITSFKHKLKQNHCQVNVSCPKDLDIYSFPGSFSQIYSNLILNSLIHGFENWSGKCEIYIDITLKHDHLYIDYRDTGKGIPEAIIDRIFDPFVTSKRGTGGSGLGTHIIYNIVNQLLKGDIQYIHEKGGAHFKISLPYTTEKKTETENS